MKPLKCWKGYLRVNDNALCRSHWHILWLFRPSGEAADTAPLYCCNPLNTPLTRNEDIPDPRKGVGASATAEWRRGPSALATKTRERISQHEEVSAAARSLVTTGCAVQKKQRGETADVHLLGLPCCSWSLSGTGASFSLREPIFLQPICESERSSKELERERGREGAGGFDTAIEAPRLPWRWPPYMAIGVKEQSEWAAEGSASNETERLKVSSRSGAEVGRTPSNGGKPGSPRSLCRCFVEHAVIRVGGRPERDFRSLNPTDAFMASRIRTQLYPLEEQPEQSNHHVPRRSGRLLADLHIRTNMAPRNVEDAQLTHANAADPIPPGITLK
ncbi:hypothetical protein D4764_15G0001320 [Takifugu flavidus]|uniref:Uncharacterized protein n=1 Tax=Takifugu flavidus TaxID=433684 RepID=A0A5C6P0V1_9TELE|nr:hypothetical protein D4764_15G0001320 [Takifugu flavidus]